MLLAISADKLPIIFAIAAVLLIHYPLAVLAAGRILQYKTRGLPEWIWHIIIQLVIIVGPIICLLVHPKKACEKKVYKPKPQQKQITDEEKKDEEDAQNGNV